MTVSPYDVLDPEIAIFVRRMIADASAHPPREQLTPPEARR
ncbi:MAG TPA: acetylesterase, partial [Tistrella mobilis]|nr:acetylesterase [Tistrella mobilis]